MAAGAGARGAPVGLILARLEQMGIAHDTLVLFSSDNGPEAHSQDRRGTEDYFRYSRGSAWPLEGMKTQLWEGGVRVPMILRWPGKIPSSYVSAAITSALDIFPTLCAAASVSIPLELKLDGGKDLVSIIRGKTPTADRPLFFEFHFPQRGVGPSLPLAVRQGKWKLFSDHDFNIFELYDLENDVGEQTDVGAEQGVRVRKLMRLLKVWWAQFAGEVQLKNIPRQPIPTPSSEELEKKYYRN